MRYHNITHDDMLNGRGLRVCLWVSGCTHNCTGCHNPETHDTNSGIPFDESAKMELFEALKNSYINGITFTGGDPLHPANAIEVGKLIKEIHLLYPKKTIWVYTGFVFDDVRHYDFINLIDVLCDGKFVEELKDSKIHWVGSSNQRVIDVKKTLLTNEVVILEK